LKICNNCNLEKRNKDFSVNNARPDNLSNRCKGCDSIIRKKYYAENPEYYKRQWKRNKYSSPELAEDRRLRAAYGISKVVRDFMEAKVNGNCEICGKAVKLVIDHDHITGDVRGLLCSTCNRGIGHFNDDINLLEKAINYIYNKTEMNRVDFK